MKNTLKLFAAAAAETVRTHKVKVAFQAAFVGSAMTGMFAAQGRADYVGAGIGWAIGTGIGQALCETGTIYNRMKREQKFSSLNNG